MKRIIILLMYCYIHASLQAQTVTRETSVDSSRYIDLDTVMLGTKQKTTHQGLIHFYKTNNASTLEDIMGRLPEISFVRRGPYGMEPSIRTLNGGQINTLVDGMRIYGACTDKMDPPTIYIEPINLENIQVQTAHTGFLSGSSIGGTINMKIAEPDYAENNKLAGIISSGYQTAARGFYESLRLNYATGKWAFRASGTYRKSNDYRSGGGEIIDNSQFEKANYSFSAKYYLNKHTYVKADLLGDDGWNIGYPALPMDVGYAAARIGSLSLHSGNKNTFLNNWSAKIYANNIRHFMDDTHRPDVAMHMDMPGISKTAGAFADGELKISSKQKLLVRADVSSSYLKASMTMYQTGQVPMYMLTWPDHRKNQYGASASWIMEIDSSMNIRINGRADLVNYHLVSQEAKEEISILGYPSADRNDYLKNLSTQFTKKLTGSIKSSLSFSYSERAPTGSELYGFYLFNSQDNFDYLGNPEINKEQSVNAELSAVYLHRSSRIQVAGFYTRIRNFITGQVDPGLSAMTIGASGVKSYINIPDAWLAGFEVSAVLKPAAYWNLVSTLRYTYAEDNLQQPLPMIPPLKNIGSVRYQPGKFSILAEYEAAGRQNRVNVESGEDSTPGYFLLHTRLGYTTQIFSSLAEIQCGLENIFDKNYHEHNDWGNIPRPGRNLYVQVKISF